MIRRILEKLTTHVKVETIVLGETTPGTPGDYQLLKQSYNTDINKKPNKKNSNFKQLIFNTKFIQHMEKKHGELHCEYCGKPNLRLYHWKHDKVKNREDMATVDHFLPKSLYPELAQEYNNLKICCYSCNQKKKDDIWSEDEIKYGYKL